MIDYKINNINDLIENCRSFVDISHETGEKLKTYADLLVKWQKKINLVSPSTLPHLWHRHIFDSAQLMKFVSRENTITDIGSGAGFPGMVLAIMGCRVRLIESDQRKCAFMADVARETGAAVELDNKRIEAAEPKPYDFITARALASLNELLGYAEPYMGMGAKALFLKGDNVSNELTFTNRLWHIKHQVHQSLTEKNASVLLIEEARRKDDRSAAQM